MKKQIQVRKIVDELGKHFGSKQGMTRREFLRTNSGMAAAFLALNMVHGPVFNVDAADITDREAAGERREKLAGQFIFDAQLHFIREDYPLEGVLGLRQLAKNWNPDLNKEEVTLERVKFENFFREVYLQSDTKVGLLSSAPADEPRNWFITNDQIFEARKIVNGRTGLRRLLGHAVFTPGQPGWLEQVDRAIQELKPDSWKGYTIGDPMGRSRYPWRLDDEKLVYPAYEKMVKAGIRNVCIHKGLLPIDFRRVLPDLWQYGTVEDVGKAAGDWPQLNFIIYHSGLQTIKADHAEDYAEFEKSRRIPWVTDLAEIPGKYRLNNVYAEIGTSFAITCTSIPQYCAAMLGTLIKGLGPDHVLWGTDSIWYGSPQWQIEAMRRIEIPEEMRKRYGFASLGGVGSPVRNGIFGNNSAMLYALKPDVDYGPLLESPKKR